MRLEREEDKLGSERGEEKVGEETSHMEKEVKKKKSWKLEMNRTGKVAGENKGKTRGRKSGEEKGWNWK
jgi:hypothetical protein